MKPKYIDDSMMLTKEAFTKYIQNLKEQNAKTYGMTVEEWDSAILNRNVVEVKPRIDVRAVIENIGKKYDSGDLNA
jgi:hypothetical protein